MNTDNLTLYPKARRASVAVRVGDVIVGGGAPVVVQSMTNTDTADCEATAQQVAQLAQAGSEVVRVTVNTPEAARQVPHIKERLLQLNCEVPLVGDFHYNGHQLLTEFPACAEALSKYRINPGNVGFGKKRDVQFTMMIEAALHHQKPVRIGVNWGSLDQSVLAQLMDDNARLTTPRSSDAVMREAMIQSALQSAAFAERLGLARDKIILACKVSGVQDLIALYQSLAARCDYALHVGLTEAGMGAKGIVATAVSLGFLLQQGIGDTIRASLTPVPGESRTREVEVCKELLQSLGLRAFAPQITACPGCGRTTSTFYQELAQSIQQFLQESMPNWRIQHPGVESMKVAVMGCVVNGPGESKHANIGISLPGTGEAPAAPIFIDGKKAMTLRGDNIIAEFKAVIAQYVSERYVA